ncbi:MAG: PstS family phosphate ABC transporter substrate-binding protein [Cyanobacteria bacterium CRU_2_1]|nr:PstS family phosphate ABC transporter substrate-binding protein [Cyanobacteria bacterium RU_5_0]NJR57795.1 PstS family phosphate ABC transporter substrate-binding protein [Cyanobacteria bacterium CRU_2_1]
MALNLHFKQPALLATLAALTLSLAACGGPTTTTAESPAEGESPAATDRESPAESPTAADDGTGVSGQIALDGSSTVFPISEAVSEEFQRANSGVQVTVGTSGTGGGFEKFCNGETDISNASRPIEQDEIEACESKGIEFIELPVAFDALSVVVHPQNDWAQCLTTEELKRIWEPAAQGQITNWNQVRPDFPDVPLALYGPGTDSGTFDYFTDAISGEEGESRGDYTASEDDNVLVQGVAGDRGAIGYFGYAYYEQNQDRVKLVGIDDGDSANGEGCVTPSAETVLDNTYQPLARPLFIYVSTKAAERPEVKAFVEFYMDEANKQLIESTGYVPLSDPIYDKALARFQENKTGTVFEGGSAVGVSLEDLLEQE